MREYKVKAKADFRPCDIAWMYLRAVPTTTGVEAHLYPAKGSAYPYYADKALDPGAYITPVYVNEALHEDDVYYVLSGDYDLAHGETRTDAHAAFAIPDCLYREAVLPSEDIRADETFYIALNKHGALKSYRHLTRALNEIDRGLVLEFKASGNEFDGCKFYPTTHRVIGVMTVERDEDDLEATMITGRVADPETAEVRIKNEVTGGEKGQKLARFDLLPTGPLWEVAELYGVGARKYAERNWERGYNWSLSYGALQRHVNLFWSGESYDKETKKHHLASVIFHALALMEFENTHPELDDRPSTLAARIRDLGGKIQEGGHE